MGSYDQPCPSNETAMPIAVVGMGFRGPGDASSLRGLWDMICEKREAWSKVPGDRWNHDAFYHPDPSRKGTTNVMGGHFIHQDLSKFDATFFSMNRPEAEALDPQQRLLLECSYEAFENAGLSLDKVYGSETSCFVGSFCGDYTDMLSRDPESMPFYQATSSGHSRAIIANRLSHFFDLHGPSVTIDTACSASLVALHLACQSLRSGETKQALVAGANVILSHEMTISMTMMRFLSPDGRCYSFDERANGYSRGEGVGCVVLKSLADAIRDGDPIQAVIRNSGSNQDGKTPGITLPSQQAQENLIRSVYAKAGMDPRKTMFVECHGTGTQAGDPMESAAVANVFTKDRNDGSVLRIGSVKTNIGHLEGASGIAGIIKSVLMLKNKKMAPNRNFERPSKRIPFGQWKLTVPTEVTEMPGDGPHVVSINSFGYGGSNAHTILQDTESALRWYHAQNSNGTVVNDSHAVNGNGQAYGTNGANGMNGDSHSTSTRLFPISANDGPGIQRQAKALAEVLQSSEDAHSAQFLDDLAYTLGERRTRFPTSRVFSGASVEELVEALNASPATGVKVMQSKNLGLVFTGQGAQWWAMGRELFSRFPVFASSLAEAEQCLNELGCPWSLKEELFKDEKSSRINEVQLSQPVCTCLQIGLVDLLASFNITAQAATGHSSGEIAAAYCAGGLTSKEAVAVAYHRGVMSDLVKQRHPTAGGMMAVSLTESEALPLLAALKKGVAVIACLNSPKSLTISGDRTALEELKGILDAKDVFARMLTVEVAYHSPHMSCVAEDYLASISDIKPPSRTTSVAFFSSVYGKRLDVTSIGPQYWVDNMLGQVKFSPSLAQMCQSPLQTQTVAKRRTANVETVTMLLEVGPHAALSGPCRQIVSAESGLREKELPILSCLVRKQNAVESLAKAVGQLWETGLPVNLATFNKSTRHHKRSPKVLTGLPAYQWQHETSYWAESRASKAYRTQPYARNDILGVPVAHSSPYDVRWRNIIRTGEMPWVKDHKVQKSVVYPAAGFMAMALEAAAQQAYERSVAVESYELREVTIGQALLVPEESGEVEVFLHMRPFSESVQSPSNMWNEFTVSSVSPTNAWTEHCRGLVRALQASSKQDVVSMPVHLDADKTKVRTFLDRVDRSAATSLSAQYFYDELTKIGLDYGPTFANLKEIRAGGHSAVSLLSVPNTAAVMPYEHETAFTIHPGTLDSLLHPLFAAMGVGSKDLLDTYVPVFIQSLSMKAAMRTDHGIALCSWTEVSPLDDRQVKASTVVFDDQVSKSMPVLEISGLICSKLAKEGAAYGNADSNAYARQANWLPSPDFLRSKDMAAMCSEMRPTAEEEQSIEALEEVGYYLMNDASKQLTEKDIDVALPHHKRLYGCMKARIAEAQGQYVADNVTRAKMFESVASSGAEGSLLVHIGRNLVPIIRKEVEALELMKEEDRLDAYYRDNSRFDRNYKQAVEFIKLVGHQNPGVSILEIGSGTGGATLPILEALTDDASDVSSFKKFTFTDISTAFFETAREKLSRWSDLIEYAPLDIESDPLQQRFEAESFDVIIAANVLHATKSMVNTMSNVRKLLRPGGKLVLIELTRERFTTSTIFGTLSGWFAGEEESRVRGPTLTETAWDALLKSTGFNGLDISLSDAQQEQHHQGSMMVGTASSPVTQHKGEEYLVISNGEAVLETESTESFIRDSLVHWLGKSEASAPFIAVEPLEKCNPSGKVCIVLCEVSKPVFDHLSEKEFEAVRSIFTTAKSILWVTRGAQMESSSPTANMVTGFARTVRSEYDTRTIITIDIDPKAAGFDDSIAAIQAVVENGLLPSAIQTEHEYVERQGQLLIPRYVPHAQMNASMKALLDPTDFEMASLHQPSRPLVIEVGTPGLLDTLRFVDDTRVNKDLPGDHVEIEVKATGFNFKDVMMAMGQIAVETLGGECSGIVRKVGSRVTSFSVGDRVSCYGFGTFASLVRQEASAVQKLPENMSFELAAALPVTFCTAYHSIFNVARVQKGQKVLIHAASGGLGQALIELCQIVGAEIFATVGTSAKRQLLIERYGIAADHILNSRNASFAPAIMAMTGNNGVDVIMNSVAGEMLRVTWDCIAPFGVFVELGARDYTINTRLEMARFARNTTFVAVNLVSLIRERPRIAEKVWRDVMTLFRENKLRGPYPLMQVPVSDIEEALRSMQSGKHLGKLVAVHGDADVVKARPAIASEKRLFSSNGSYLLIGGMGGLGRAMALWMQERGAQNFIFGSRSGLDKQEARDLKMTLEAGGARVVVEKCDVASKVDLQRLMDAATHLPPVKGVVQGAMVLQDVLLANMQLKEYDAVVRPKVDGTWNLHNLFQGHDLEFFLMLSSASGIIGNASQAAYAASSTFLDAFAQYRRSLGMAASTLDLGVISGIGYVSQNKDLAKALERQGFAATDEDELMALFHSAMATKSVHSITGLGTWKEGSLAAFDRPIFSLFRRSANQGASGGAGENKAAAALLVRESLRSATTMDAAVSCVCAGLVAKVASLCMIPAEEIDASRTLAEYRMDSLVAVEMRNWIAREMDASVPILELMANESITALSRKIVTKSHLVDVSKLS